MEKVECRNCKQKFDVDGNRANVQCPNCKRNVNLLWEPMKKGESFKCGLVENLPKN